MSEPRLHLTRVLDAPRERVFRAWTDPEELKRWWGPRGYVTRSAEIDLRAGGNYRLGMAKLPDGPTFYLTGTFTLVEPPTHLAYTWRWEAEPEQGETLVTVTFRDLSRESTEVTVTHERFPSEKIADDHARGWAGCLDRLVETI